MSLPIPPNAKSALYPIAKEFMRLSYDLLGAYLDALGGLDAIREKLFRYQSETIDRLKQSDPNNASEQFMDQQSFSHEFSVDEHAAQKLLHRATQREFKQRSGPGELDARLLGYMMIALLFGSWEDEYRQKFALALGHSNKKEIKADLFGDLGNLRNAIVHNHGIATQAVEDAKILRWFKRGDQMFISSRHVDLLFDQIDAYVTSLCEIPLMP